MSESVISPLRRRWFRFSLRTLLALVIVVAIPLAWIAKERRQSKYEQQVAKQLFDKGFLAVHLGGPYDAWQYLNNAYIPPAWWQDLAHRVLGERISMVYGPQIDFNDRAPLAELTNLQMIQLHSTQVRDLSPLAGSTKMRELVLIFMPVSDLSPIATLTNLEELWLLDTQASDLTPLAGLAKLKILNVWGPNVTHEQVALLRKALPNCKITDVPFR